MINCYDICIFSALSCKTSHYIFVKEYSMIALFTKCIFLATSSHVTAHSIDMCQNQIQHGRVSDKTRPTRYYLLSAPQPSKYIVPTFLWLSFRFHNYKICGWQWPYITTSIWNQACYFHCLMPKNELALLVWSNFQLRNCNFFAPLCSQDETFLLNCPVNPTRAYLEILVLVLCYCATAPGATSTSTP